MHLNCADVSASCSSGWIVKRCVQVDCTTPVWACLPGAGKSADQQIYHSTFLKTKAVPVLLHIQNLLECVCRCTGGLQPNGCARTFVLAGRDGGEWWACFVCMPAPQNLHTLACTCPPLPATHGLPSLHPSHHVRTRTIVRGRQRNR